MRTQRTVAMAVHRLGGTCSWRELRRSVPWRSIGPAVASGEIVRHGHGVYGLPGADAARVAAGRLHGVTSHRSAALHWGWKVKFAPDQLDVTIPANRKLRESQRGLATLHWRSLPDRQVIDGVTSRPRTVLDCCLDLPFDEALSVFDSALRSGLQRREVVELAMTLGSRQRARVLKVARHADRRAANPFESVLRAIALGVPGLSVEPQVRLRYDDLYARATSPTSRYRSSRRPTATSSTPSGGRSIATAGATTSWPCATGSCCASRGSRSCSIQGGCSASSPPPWRTVGPSPRRDG